MYAGKKISLFNIWNNTEVELRKEKSMDIPVSVTLIKWHGFISEEQNLSEDEKKKIFFLSVFGFLVKLQMHGNISTLFFLIVCSVER